MSTAAIIAANAAAAAREAEERVTSHLLGRNAVSADDATLLAPDRAAEARALVSLLDRGVVREAGGGRYWLDRDALKRGYGGKRRVVLLLAVIVALLVLAGGLLLMLEDDQGDLVGNGWRADPLSPAGVALVHTGRRGVEWEIRCRTTPADLMVVTTDRPRGDVELRLDGQPFPLEVEAQDGGAGVFAFGPVTPAFLQVLQDGAEVEVHHGPRGRQLGAVSAAQAGPFVEACRSLQPPPAP